MKIRKHSRILALALALVMVLPLISIPTFADSNGTLLNAQATPGARAADIYTLDFEDDSFVICRFSGTEPLLRIFAEASEAETAKQYISDFKSFLGM